jgi:hypothetical protein
MYLGFEGEASALFRTSRPRRAEQRSKGDAPVRSVYQVRSEVTPSLCTMCVMADGSAYSAYCRRQEVITHVTTQLQHIVPTWIRGWSSAAPAWASRRCWRGWQRRPGPAAQRQAAARAPAPPPPPAQSL